MFKQITAGYSRSLALFDDLSVWAWGNIGRTGLTVAAGDPLFAICGSGPLEIGHNRFAQPVPQRLNPQVPFQCVDDAAVELLALTPAGQVSRLATAASVTDGAAAELISGLTGGVRDLCSNETARYALDVFGRVWSWGGNFQGQLGRTEAVHLNQPPAVIEGLPPVIALAGGQNHVLALTDSGEVWSWGANAAGQLGLGNLRPAYKPERIELDTAVIAIASGDTHSLAIDDEGHLHAWGSNHCGQLGPLGLGISDRSISRPVRVQLPFGVRQAGAGRHFSVALNEHREVFAWGWNGFKQLGEHSLESTSDPLRVAGLGRIETISVGPFHALALDDKDQNLYAWGDNRNAACGLPVSQPAVGRPHRITFV